MQQRTNRTHSGHPAAQHRIPQQPSRDEVRRRHAQKMQKRRRRRRRLACAAVLLVAVAVCVVLSLTVFFKIETVTVTGDSRYTAEEIISASGIQVGQNLFLTNVEEAAAQIESQKPYIRTAVVRRKLPATIEITVEPTATAALGVRTDGGYILLDTGLKVLENGSGDLPDGVAELRVGTITASADGTVVQAETPNVLDTLSSLLAAMDQAGVSGITLYDLTNPEDILLTYDGRLDVQVGSTDNLAKKMAMLAEVIRRNDETDPQRSGTIDLRVNGKAYLSGSRTVVS